MFVPDGYTEEEVYAIMDRVIKPLAEMMKFGHYGVDDMFQEGVLTTLPILSAYDDTQGCSLDNFIRIHVRNRFINLRRDKLYRTQSPCRFCGCECVECGDCDKYRAWLKRNNDKRALMECGELTQDVSTRDDDTAERLWTTELYNYVLAHISLANRGFLLKFLDDVHVPKKKYEVMMEEIKQLAEDFSNASEKC